MSDIQQRAADAVKNRSVQRINVPMTLQTRAATDETANAGEFTGKAVPYNSDSDRTGWGLEQISATAIDPATIKGLPLMYEHKTSIGVLTGAESRDDGLYVDGKISQTTLGKDVIILVQDGGVAHMSISFYGRVYQYDADNERIIWTEVEMLEISLVPIPAYVDTNVSLDRGIAKVEAERQAQAEEEPVADPAADTTENTTPTNEMTPTNEGPEQSAEAEKEVTMTEQEIRELFDSLKGELSTRDADNNKVVLERMEDMQRAFTSANRPAQVAQADHRSVGAYVKALVRGDEHTLENYRTTVEQRAFADNAEVLADTNPKPIFVKDLSQIAADVSPIVSVFETGVLPAEGNTLEFGQLNSNTIKTDIQANEGDTLVKGKISFKSATTPVFTLGGYTELSRQAIERSSIPILDRVFEAQAKSLGFSRGLLVRNAFVAQRDANAAKTGANAYKVSVGANPDGKAYIGAVVDGAVLAAQNGVTIDTFLVGPARFKLLAGLQDSANRPIFRVYDTGTDVIGIVNPKALTGEVANLVVVLDPSLADGKEGFVSKDALRLYASNGVQLSDGNVTNLTQQFSIYQYAAIATEIPNGIIPVVFA